MNKLISGIFHSKATLVSLLVLVGVVATASLAQAWGPARKTFTIEKPANYVTFNSITNSPYGDERNFVRIKEASQPDSAYTDELKLVPGKTYRIYTFFHNNAAANLNLTAVNTRLKVYIPNEIKAGQKLRIDSKISAANAKPNEVYDEVYVSTDSDIALRYVANSAQLTTKKVTNLGMNFDEMLGQGALIGTYGKDGLVPGCNEFSGYVTYDFTVVQPNFTVQKDVRVKGQTAWTNDLKGVKAGDILEYRVVYTNTGSIDQKDVAIKDALPKGLTYVAGSAELRNAATNGYVKLTTEADNYFKNHGWIKLGNYAPRANAVVRYQLKVEAANDMNCGHNTYTNIVSAVTQNGTKQATAKVSAHKQCEAKNITVCELSTKKIITIKEADFKSNLHSKNLNDCSTTPNKPKTPEKPTPSTPDNPSTPNQLPSTGLGIDSLASLIGLVSLVGSAGYYINSRKA